MAFKKKTYARSRRTYGKRNSTRAIASRALRVARSVTKKIEYDHKITAGSGAVSTTGTVFPLHLIPQGTGDSERIGDKITVRNILGRVSFIMNSSATNTLFRFIIFQDKQQVGDTSPGISDVLATSSTLSSLNTNAAGRFKVIKNWFFQMDSVKGATKTIQFYKKVNTNLRFNGTLNSDIQKNGLYVLLLSDQGTNTPTVYYNFKIGYADI